MTLKYSSAMFELSITKCRSNWEIKYQNIQSGLGVFKKTVSKELPYDKVKFCALRLALPLLVDLDGVNQFSDKFCLLKRLNTFEKFHFGARSILCQILVVANLDNYSQLSINIYKFFAQDLIRNVFPELAHSVEIISMDNNSKIELEDQSKILFSNLLSLALDNKPTQKLCDCFDDTNDVKSILEIPYIKNEETSDIISNLQSSCENKDYYHKKITSFASSYTINSLETALSLRNSLRAFNTTDLDLKNLLNNSIKNRTPLSFIRIGEGEGSFLSYREYLQNPNFRTEIYGLISKDIFRIWFNKEIKNIDTKVYQNILMIYDKAILNADFLGVPSVERIIYEYTIMLDEFHESGYSRGYIGLCVAMRHLLKTLKLSTVQKRMIGCCDIARPLYSWQSLENSLLSILPTLLYKLDSIKVISCHKQLKYFLSRFLLIDNVEIIEIPPEKGRISSSNLLKGDHLANYFEDIYNSLATCSGEVVLVAAGFLGKLYCHKIKESGGVAIDIGSLADYWANIATRRNDSSSLISPYFMEWSCPL